MDERSISRLRSLVNRRIYHLPFSRSLRLGVTEADAIKEILVECIRNGGILVVQPDHILSLKLIGLECGINSNELAKSLLGTQSFFDAKSRDVIDESDENFSVRF